MYFKRKDRWVKDCPWNQCPKTSSYAGISPQESIQIALTYVDLNYIDTMPADISNKYLQVPFLE